MPKVIKLQRKNATNDRCVPEASSRLVKPVPTHPTCPPCNNLRPTGETLLRMQTDNQSYPSPKLENLRGLIEATASTSWPIVLVAFILLAMAGGLFLFWLSARRKRSRRLQIVSPCDAAEQALEQAQQEENDDTFAAQASYAVRTCLVALLPAPIAATTTELANQLESTPLIRARQIHQLLQTCDSVKFSGKPLSEEQRIRIFETACKSCRGAPATAVSEQKTAQT